MIKKKPDMDLALPEQTVERGVCLVANACDPGE